MGKKKNKHMNEVEQNEGYEFEGGHGHGHDSPIPYPDRFDRDQLAMMDDEELHNLGRFLFDSIQKVNRLHLNPYPWEIELCYVQQEAQVRSSRRQAHMAWMNGGGAAVAASPEMV